MSAPFEFVRMSAPFDFVRMSAPFPDVRMSAPFEFLRTSVNIEYCVRMNVSLSLAHAIEFCLGRISLEPGRVNFRGIGTDTPWVGEHGN